MQNLQDVGVTPYQAAKPQASKPLTEILRSVCQLFIDLTTVAVLLLPMFFKYLKQLILPPPPKQISGQVAIVTGGANGLGRELCLRLAKEGCNIAVADLDLINAEKTAADVRGFNVSAKAYKLDVSDIESVEKVRQQIEMDLGPVDILVNNAGVLPLVSLREGKPSDIKKIIDVNLTSHLYTTRVFIESMIKQKRGHIMAIASAAAYAPNGRVIAYTASKYGVRGMMESLDDELFIDGHADEIHTTCVFPFFINTRKELIETLDKLKFSDRIPVFSAEFVADVAVKGMLNNKTKVAIPQWTLPFLEHYEQLPRGVRRLIRDVLLKGPVPKLMD